MNEYLPTKPNHSLLEEVRESLGHILQTPEWAFRSEHAFAAAIITDWVDNVLAESDNIEARRNGVQNEIAICDQEDDDLRAAIRAIEKAGLADEVEEAAVAAIEVQAICNWTARNMWVRVLGVIDSYEYAVKNGVER